MTPKQREAKIEACVVFRTTEGFLVASPSGTTYEVERERGTLYCSCPARGRSCVHLAAVVQYLGKGGVTC